VNRLRLTIHVCFAALLCLILPSATSFADGQGTAIAPATPSSYSFGDVLTLSAVGGTVPSFTPLSIWNFTEGWLEPWIPPPNGELHLQRGGWVNTDSAFFSRELDPTFSFNAGTGGTRDEYIGAVSLFIPLNRRLQIGLTVPFVDSLKEATSCQPRPALVMSFACHWLHGGRYGVACHLTNCWPCCSISRFGAVVCRNRQS
jgi:hypothetical protein